LFLEGRPVRKLAVTAFAYHDGGTIAQDKQEHSMSGKTTPAIAVPVHRYQQLQEAFVVTTARHCAERAGSSCQPRTFNPDDMFIDLIRWLWGELDDGMPVPQAQGEGLVITALADHFHTVNAILAGEDSSETEDDDDEAARWGAMSLDDMLTGLAVAGLRGYLGQAGWDRLCAQARELIPAWTGLTAEGKPAHLMVPRQEPPAGKWDASADVTYSGRAREGWEDEENPLGQVTITEPGDVTRTFTHYPEHPDDPDYRELTWGYVGSGPLAAGALILNDALGFGTPGSIDHAGVMPGGGPSPMLVAFTEDIVAKFPRQPGRASWQLSRSAVLQWISKWRAENDASGEATSGT
jgi:hypothetical protein